jgi:23S rRNA pseudouridine2604 synthase
MTVRINKLLSNKGICSRKQANEWIEAKRILVNGTLCIPGQWVEEQDDILIDNEPISQRKKVYILLNKPTGITCTAAPEVKDNIISFLNYPEYIFPVGRLDKASQGLILMTNDGDLANKILNSEHQHEKEYQVMVDKPFDQTFVQKMSEGVDLGDVITRPCKVIRINDNTFNITITQGLNKQIRRMSKAFGYTVMRLERIRILNITIDGLEYGKWRELTQAEINELRIC